MAIYNGFKAYTLSKAFVLNAFVGAFIATLIIELRISLHDEKTGCTTF